VYDLRRDGAKLLFRAVTNACINATQRQRAMIRLHDPDASGSAGENLLVDHREQDPIVHARGQRERPHRWLKEATLEIDRETRVVRRATVARLLRDGTTVTTTFTLVSSEAQQAGRYELDGHLENPFQVLTRDYRPQQRRQILDRLFGPRSFATAPNRNATSSKVDEDA
jgi:hypothetical protein